MAADLPDEFDVIVLGTGFPECIVAAAFSRIGLKVLHLDRNSYYCGSWASLSLRSIPHWVKEQKESMCYVSAVDQEKLSTLVKEGEKAVQLPETFHVVTDPESKYHVGKRPEEVPESSESSANTHKSDAANATGADSVVRTDDSDNTQAAEQSDVPQTDSETASDAPPGQFDLVPEEKESPTACAQGEAVQGTAAESAAEKAEGKARQEWFADDVENLWRKFCFDLAPKLLYCSGSMVELLVVSDVAKYCEFRTVSRVLTLRDRKLEKVPCSRADVFSSKALSLMEKRLLMKFLTFAAEYDKKTEEYKDFLDKSFVEFLASRQLSPKIQHFILHSIAMATQSTPTDQGLESTQKFLRSLGRYGNTAFLFPLYGTGELPQGFCRLSAVFGGVYVLTVSVSHLLIDADNKCTAVITSTGQRVACKYLIADPSYLPKEFYHVSEASPISRGIFVTDRTVLSGEGEDLSLLQFPHEGQLSSPTTTVLELPPSANVSPRPLYLVHMTRRAVSDVHTDLQPAVSTLFQCDEPAEAGKDGEEKPKVLWSLTYQQRDLTDIRTTEQAPSNLFVAAGPGMEMDLDRCVAEAKTIFKEICPEEEFLSKPPHPDDIIYVDTEEVAAAGNKQGDWAGDSATETSSAQNTAVSRDAQSEQSTDEGVEKEEGAAFKTSEEKEVKGGCGDGESGEQTAQQKEEKNLDDGCTAES